LSIWSSSSVGTGVNQEDIKRGGREERRVGCPMEKS
jgi:hypothetical protein